MNEAVNIVNTQAVHVSLQVAVLTFSKKNKHVLATHDDPQSYQFV